MINAKRIGDTVEIALGEDFLAADKPSELGAQIQPSALEECFEGLDLARFDELLAKTQVENERYNTAMDIAMAVKLHRSLPITRRQASDMRFWAWLGIEHAPDYVAWRWKPSGKLSTRSRERFCGDRVRQTFARLWWAAELTRDGDDYTLTACLLNLPGFQDVYEAIFGRTFGNFRPAMAVFISVVDGKKEKFIRDFTKQLGYALTTSTLETMTEDRLQELMTNLVERMKKKAGQF